MALVYGIGGTWNKEHRISSVQFQANAAQTIIFVWDAERGAELTRQGNSITSARIVEFDTKYNLQYFNSLTIGAS
jgi:hypothetical protein